jgi:hypothetical protein
MDTMKLMQLFDEPFSGRLRVHEANAEVVIEIGGVSIPVTGARWKSRKVSGRRQYTLTLQGDAAELAYCTQQKAQDATERAQELVDDRRPAPALLGRSAGVSVTR